MTKDEKEYCRLRFHNWHKWGSHTDKVVEDENHIHIQQIRSCKRCGKKQGFIKSLKKKSGY